MNTDQALLTIYVPIYNRASYLERMLDVFLEDREVFGEKVTLIISDNCSQDDLEGICTRYKTLGLAVNYHRNATNIGGDANILQGFTSASGKYVWVLGSDDIPVCGFIPQLLAHLQEREYGVLHLADYSRSNSFVVYEDGGRFFEDINVWVTFISANIVATEFVKDVDFSRYVKTSFAQMPLYLTAALSGKTNAVFNCNWLQKGSDCEQNGGYNFFDAFVSQYLSILHEKVDSADLSGHSYDVIKRKQFDFILPYIVRLLIMRKKSNWDVTAGCSTVLRFYGREPYAYLKLLKYCVSHLL